MTPHQILVRPVITERASEQTERFNQVAFQVLTAASKFQIRDAVEQIYSVSVEKVNTMTVPGKLKRRGKSIGKRPNWKKAIVTLKKGDAIDFYAAE